MAVISPPERAMRWGSETIALAQLNKIVTFTMSMPTSNYDVWFKNNGMNASATAVSKTTTGFTINLGVSVSGTLDWAVVENR